MLKSACATLFTGKRSCWSPQKLTVVAVPGFRNVTAVTMIVFPVISWTKLSCTMLTVPLTVLVPPGFETKPTKKASQPAVISD